MNQICNTGSEEQNIIVRCGRFHLCTHTIAQVTESKSCSNPAVWTAVASRLQWHSYNCTFSVINHYLIRFAYIMALGQPVLSGSAVQNIQWIMLCVNDHQSTMVSSQNPSLELHRDECVSQNVSWRRRHFQKVKLTASMKSMRCFQMVRCSNCPHLTSNSTHV